MCNVEDFLNVMAKNRRRHGRAWIKVRKDRIEKIVHKDCVDTVLNVALENNQIRACLKQVEGDELVEAFQLSGHEYIRRSDRRY